MKNKIYDPFLDGNSAESKVIEYRRRARNLINKEGENTGMTYMAWEITTTAQMLQLEEKG